MFTTISSDDSGSRSQQNVDVSFRTTEGPSLDIPCAESASGYYDSVEHPVGLTETWTLENYMFSGSTYPRYNCKSGGCNVDQACEHPVRGTLPATNALRAFRAGSRVC